MKYRRLNGRFFIAWRVLSLCALWLSVDPARAADIYEYAKEACVHLGPFPSFNAFDPSFSRELPITQNGVLLTGATATSTSLCDRPPLLGPLTEGQAIPYSRIGRLPGFDPVTFLPTTDVLWMFMARRYRIRSNADHPWFEDVAIIGHNRRSGATAFFQAGVGTQGVDATKVPSPMGFRPLPDEPAADSFWLPPSVTANIGCYRCHDNGPFVHSPYVDQVRVDGEPVVPLLDRNPPGPYWFIGSEEFSTWPTPKYMSKSGNSCTSCHVIGNGSKSADFIRFFTGRQSPPQITDAFRQYPLSHYMPNVSLTDGFPTQESWEAAYGRSVDEVLDCKIDLDNPMCWTPFGRLDDPGPAGAIYVDANGLLPTELGTREFPFKTLAKGYDAVNPGNALVVNAGAYFASHLSKPLTIVRQDPKTTGQVTIRNGEAMVAGPERTPAAAGADDAMTKQFDP